MKSEEFFPYMEFDSEFPSVPEYIEDGTVFRNLTSDQIYGFPGTFFQKSSKILFFFLRQIWRIMFVRVGVRRKRGIERRQTRRI